MPTKIAANSPSERRQRMTPRRRGRRRALRPSSAASVPSAAAAQQRDGGHEFERPVFGIAPAANTPTSAKHTIAARSRSRAPGSSQTASAGPRFSSISLRGWRRRHRSAGARIASACLCQTAKPLGDGGAEDEKAQVQRQRRGDDQPPARRRRSAAGCRAAPCRRRR